MSKKIIIPLAGLMFISLCNGVFGAKIYSSDKEIGRLVKAARTKTGKVIVASPDGKVAGSLSLSDAVNKLHPGSILRITPGDYADKGYHYCNSIDIEHQNVVIEGDGSGSFCKINITLWGDKCVVRDIWIHTLEGSGMTVVDSRVRPLITSSKKRTTTYFYNCLIYSTHHYLVNVYAHNTKVIFKNCTLISMFIPQMLVSDWIVNGKVIKRGGFGAIINLGRMARKGVITFSDCVIYTNGYLFRGTYGLDSLNEIKKSLEVVFNNSMIHYEKGFIKTSDKDKKDNVEVNFKDMKSYCRIKTEKDNILKKAEFLQDPRPYSYRNRGKIYTLSDASEAKKLGIGANIGENGIPEPVNQTDL